MTAEVKEKTTLVPLGDREVEMRSPTEGGLVVLAKVSRGMPKVDSAAELSDEQRAKLIRSLGTLGQIVEEMLVQDDDKDWLDEVMINGKVTAEAVFDAIRVAGEKLNGTTAPTTGPQPVRRRR